MSKRSRIIILCSVLLAICVIAGAITSLVKAGETNNLNSESLIFTIGIILIGILSVIIVYFTKVRKLKYEKMLDASYFQKYEIIRDAIGNSQLTKNSKQEIMEDVIDLFITAQNAGKTANEVVENPKEFSNEIILSSSNPFNHAILSLLDGVKYFIFFVFGVNILQWIEQTDRSFFGIETDISMIMLFVLISFVLIPVTKKLTSSENPWMYILPLAFGIVYVLLMTFLRRYFYDIGAVRSMLDGTVMLLPNITISMVYLLSIPVLNRIKMLVRKRKVNH